MATYYVRPNGSDSNSGTGPGINQAWSTITKALSNTSGLVGGDIVYVAPGHYLEQVTIGITSPSSTIQIIGDVTGAQFSLPAGFVRLSGFSSAGNAAIVYTGSILKGTSKNNLSFSNFIFEGKGSGGGPGVGLVAFVTSQNISFSKCIFAQEGNDGGGSGGAVVDMSAPTSSPLNATFSKCVFGSARYMVYLKGNNVADTTSVKDCIFYGGQYQLNTLSCQISVFNTTFQGASVSAFSIDSGSATFTSTLRNNIFLYCAVGIASTASHRTEDYNRFIGAASTGATPGSNSSTVGASRLTYGYARMVGLYTADFWSPEVNSPNQGFGTATGAEATDVYSTAWTGATPDAGYQTYSLLTNLAPNYLPTERNASTITIAPGETSRSLYLYLGVTGLTHTTLNITASYTRNGQASVPITLVAQTPTGSYVSGGFCEVSAPYARGTYRLDVPNAAFGFGADDVTIFVGGANTTNGAVVTCNMQGIAGNIVHIGPFKVIADGLGSDQPLDIVQGVQAPVSVQLVDANENGVDISGATVEAKVYNAIGSLIATYVCVPVYAADGRCTFQLTTLVTNTAGVYNVTLTRTIGGNIIVFGPMKMIVRAN